MATVGSSLASAKAAIFDIGATLVEGPPIAPNKVIASLVDGTSADEVAGIIMTRALACADEVCKALEEKVGKLSEGARLSIKRLWESQSYAAKEIAGATETVLAVKRRGVRIGLLSDIWKPYYLSVERALPRVIQAVDAEVLSFKSGTRKPCYDNFLQIIAKLGIKPEEAVMIGDTYTHDILPAIEIGMRTVWVLTRPEREAESIISVLNNSSLAPTFTVSNITEVAELPLWPVAPSQVAFASK